jgi:tetratricopeptide (TPR) repeat protein
MTPESSNSSAELNPDLLKEEGLDLFQKGARDEALSVFEQAANAFSLAGDRAGEAEMYNNIGVIYRLQKKWSESIEALVRAETGFKEAGDDLRRAQVLGNLGDLSSSMGQHEDAARYYSESSELFSSVGEGDLQGQVLRAFSLMRLKQRRWIESIDLMSLSVEVRAHPSTGQKMLYYLLQIARKLLRTR